MSSIKKKLCNPPLIRFAEAGDPEVAGHFEGALLAVDDIPDVGLCDDFVRRVTEVENAYVDARKKLAADTVARMYALSTELVTAVDALNRQRST